MMFYGPAELTSDPVRGEFDDGLFVYTADATLRPSGRPIVAVMHPPVAGMVLPYTKGSLVLVGGFGGTGYVTGEFTSADAHEGHTLLAARASDKDVRLGRGADVVFGWQAFMLYERAHLDFEAAKSALQLIAASVATLMDAALAGDGTTWLQEVISPALANMASGQPSAGVKGRAE